MRTRLVALLLALPALLSPSLAPAQPQQAEPTKARNALYIEGGGSAVVYSINYERHTSDAVRLRAGLSAYGLLLLPLTASYLVFEGNHHIELGAGAVLSYWKHPKSDVDDVNDPSHFAVFEPGFGVAGALILGYRYQAAEEGFIFRIGATPLIGPNHDKVYAGSLRYIWPWAGVGLGTVF